MKSLKRDLGAEEISEKCGGLKKSLKRDFVAKIMKSKGSWGERRYQGACLLFGVEICRSLRFGTRALRVYYIVATREILRNSVVTAFPVHLSKQ